MKNKNNCLVLSVCTLVILSPLSAHAIYPKLSTSLIDTSNSKVVGNAYVNQSRYPTPGVITINISNFEPSKNFSTLEIYIDTCTLKPNIGSIGITYGKGSLKTTLPLYCQIALNTSINFHNEFNKIVVKGITPWKK